MNDVAAGNHSACLLRTIKFALGSAALKGKGEIQGDRIYDQEKSSIIHLDDEMRNKTTLLIPFEQLKTIVKNNKYMNKY